jgi:hypothetical protein
VGEFFTRKLCASSQSVQACLNTGFDTCLVIPTRIEVQELRFTWLLDHRAERGEQLSKGGLIFLQQGLKLPPVPLSKPLR